MTLSAVLRTVNGRVEDEYLHLAQSWPKDWNFWQRGSVVESQNKVFVRSVWVLEGETQRPGSGASVIRYMSLAQPMKGFQKPALWLCLAPVDFARVCHDGWGCNCVILDELGFPSFLELPIVGLRSLY